MFYRGDNMSVFLQRFIQDKKYFLIVITTTIIMGFLFGFYQYKHTQPMIQQFFHSFFYFNIENWNNSGFTNYWCFDKDIALKKHSGVTGYTQTEIKSNNFTGTIYRKANADRHLVSAVITDKNDSSNRKIVLTFTSTSPGL